MSLVNKLCDHLKSSAKQGKMNKKIVGRMISYGERVMLMM